MRRPPSGCRRSRRATRLARAQEPAVALGARLACIGADDATRVDAIGEGGLQLLLVAVVGDDEDRRSGRRPACGRPLRRGSPPSADPGPAVEAHGLRNRGEGHPLAVAKAALDRARVVPGDRARVEPAAAPAAPRRRARPSRPAPSGSGSRAAGCRSPTRRRDRRPRARAATPRAAAPAPAETTSRGR